MAELFERALPDALDAGMTPTEFWQSTIAEIQQVVESFQRRQKMRMQEQAILDYKHAGLVASLISGRSQAIYEVYPWLFEPEDQNWKIAKERLMRYADAHNRKREVKQIDD